MTDAEGRKQHIQNLLQKAERLHQNLDGSFSDRLVSSIYKEATAIARSSVIESGNRRAGWDVYFDRIATHPVTGFPLMFLILAAIFWITIEGANYPSQLIARGLFWFEGWAAGLFFQLGAPPWLTGFLWHGVWRGLAWVVSVMLPPMAIFFPLFTILEDFGYLPRVAFNMDALFRRVGAHGKQALTMAMGFGCNAAGVISTRIIDSPRERLIAIITNNFVPCNGRWPTLIMMATIFIAAPFPAGVGSLVAAASLMAVTLFGVFMTLVVSFGLSKTLLKGTPSVFTLELPPYRKPRILQTLYTSLIDRTIFVLWRAIIMAAPAGAVIWILGNTHIGGLPLSNHIANALDPLGRLIGLDGVVLLAYIIAIPANEIVIPTIIMAYSQASMMIELDSLEALRHLLVDQHGWTIVTAISLMLFSLLHNPCSTTILTIWKETRSAKWTAVATFLPLTIAFIVNFLFVQIVLFFM
ncbi:MAG: nucleoside recognition domain-containing protein [candidate division KSB1 bacterium]|nr:nucleoside recognition domain-containing protein [candidate division KSB1 bacterium]MDQ7064822.1 nucleoside recognition domain-containing protein [candidate division KSB1 bacterium]